MSAGTRLVIPDAGPLISLAKGGAIDVLTLLGLPIVIADQVYFEATRNPDFDDARRIARFVETHTDLVEVFTTAVGTAAAQRRAAGETGRQKGQGEAAMAELLARLDEVTGDAETPVLVLFEDSDILKSTFVLPANAHLISTRALLDGLELSGRIKSADAIWREIERAGRAPFSGRVDGRP